MKDKIKTIYVLMKTDRGLFQVDVSEETKKEIFKLLDKEKIVIINKDLKREFRV